MTGQLDALALLNAERYGDDSVASAVLGDCDSQAVIVALVQHFFALDDTYFRAGGSPETVLDDYLHRAADAATRRWAAS